MKQENILQVIAKDFGTSDLNKINEILKSEKMNHIKYRLTGKTFDHYGYTVNLKSITQDGVKIILVNKVKLIRFEDIEQFDKAKPRSERPVREKKPVVDSPKKAFSKFDKKNKSSAALNLKGAENEDENDDDDDDDDDDFDVEEADVKVRRASKKSRSGGSMYIPSKKR